jgi:hypothetical protein
MELETFLARCDRLCTSSGVSPARLSTILFGSGVTLGRVQAGKNVTIHVLQRAVERLAKEERARKPSEAA